MVNERESELKNVWPYILLPPIVLNAGSLLLIGGMYAFKYATSAPRSPGVFQISSSQIQFAMSILIFFVEWLFALILYFRYRKSNDSIRSLFSAKCDSLRFRWGPAILLFIALNGLFIIYILRLIAKMPNLTYRDMTPLQAVLFLALTPITAAFTEELIWRGHIISGLELCGKRPLVAILISSIAFALIHGLFFPDKLLVTFLIAIVAGMYYTRERNLLPLIFTHWFMDVWSFGLFFFR